MASALLPRSPWLVSTTLLAALASFFGLLCLLIVAAAPDLLYTPWPLPFVNLSWWQFALISLPFANLVLAVGVDAFASRALSRSGGSRSTRGYFLAVSLALLAFNAVMIL